MKKIIYAISALAILAGCAKEADSASSERAEGIDLGMTLQVSNPQTKVVYEGGSHIKWVSGDNLWIAAVNPVTGKPVQVASKAGYEASQYFSSFSIADAAAQEPQFKGSLYSIVESEWADTYTIYGLYPKAALYNEKSSDLAKARVTLKSEQKSTQTSWEGSQDIMVVKPSSISTADYTYDEKYQEYTSSQSETIEFAHIFGFGCISFAGIPEEYKNQVVKTVTISATGSNKNLTGSYYIDLTKDVAAPDFAIVPAYPADNITLAGDGTTTISDYKAWFVANPGTFDVNVTIKTNAADFTFERQGLVIRRSEIASPTINCKAADTVASHDIDLTGDVLWQHITSVGGYSSFLSSTAKEKEWGTVPELAKMVFGVSYPGETNSNYPTNTSGVQIVSSNPVTGGSVVLESAAAFKGVKNIKVNTGIYTNDATCDFAVYFVDKAGKETAVAPAVQLTGTNANVKGTDFYFNVPESASYGRVKLVWDNYSNTSARAYISEITLNTAPGIKLGTDAVKVPATAESGEIECGIFLAEGEPSVAVSEDWITASYADGKISYSVAANEGGKRTATITVTATGIGESAATINVKQASAVAVEYRMTIDAKTIEADFQAAAEAYTGTLSETSTLSFTSNITAVATDGSGKTLAIPVSFANIYYDNIGEYITAKSGYSESSQGVIKSVESLGYISGMKIIASKAASTSAYSGFNVTLSKDGSSWSGRLSATTTSENSVHTSVIENDDEDYMWFKLLASDKVLYTSIEITFTGE